MTFLNWAMLAGMAAVAIPIIIHLLNRRRATVVDWGAMRFLLDSLTSRRRRILIEEIILMALRCLVLALLVLAMARPFLPSRSAIPWALVLPAILAAVMGLGMAATLWAHHRRVGKALLYAAGGLVLFAALATVLEHWMQTDYWSSFGKGGRDIAIVIDGSTSMTLAAGGETNFEQAVGEARTVVATCQPSDAVSLILAGPVPQEVIPSPTSEREVIESALRELAPSGGPAAVVKAIQAAATSLAQGHNAAKIIVFITDGQRVGWEPGSKARWQAIAGMLEEFPSPPMVLCRTLPLPRTFYNATVADVTFSRSVVGTDRPVGIDVKVINTGTAPVEPSAVALEVDGKPVSRKPVGKIGTNAAETVRFSHRFEEPGLHVVAAQVVGEDELPADNTQARVLEVIDTLPVLIVEGMPSARPLEGAAAFLDIALTPRSKSDSTVSAADRGAAADHKTEYLVVPTVIPVQEIRRVKDLEPYAVVILANVPRLPQEAAAELVRFVENGGGLLIGLGDRASASFYNGWTDSAGRPMAPASLQRRRTPADTPAHLRLKSFRHPALTLVANSPDSDVGQAVVTSYWKLSAFEKDPDVRVGALFDSGDPVMVERKVGDGHVLMTALSLDFKDSNLPGLDCFVPMVHEFVYYLAAPILAQVNVRPGAELVMELRPRGPQASTGGGLKAEEMPVEVVTPSKQTNKSSVTVDGDALRLTYSGTYEPGLYRFRVPRGLVERYRPAALNGEIPFVVLSDPEESRMVPLSNLDLKSIREHLDIFRAQTSEELTTAVTGSVPGEELWKYLAVALLLGLIAEIALTRWIASRRRLHDLETIHFRHEYVDIQGFRARAEKMLAVPTPQPQEASKR